MLAEQPDDVASAAHPASRTGTTVAMAAGRQPRFTG